MSESGGRKRRMRYSADPNNRAWSDDKSKFGHKMLEKMGWKEGSCLGKDLQGKTSHVSVRLKNDREGMLSFYASVLHAVHVVPMMDRYGLGDVPMCVRAL
jgi:G-patch protein